ncbi:hypothetical protein O181_055510 [Austropuccinia psidii MF-1]|uniref:Uncharacterized protein n=1 Tax=Austropuccinia psidii MF-1 TaxID=1389203 RepID=A0A9Q3EAW8_9BASI|nr:hypothetical protein [Austropuccinia psidii MF-1]
MVNWPYDKFMANFTPLVLYGLLAIAPFHWANMAPNLLYVLRPYPAFIRLIGRFPTSPTPRPFSLFLGLGVFSVFQRPLAPLATTRNLGPTLYIKGWTLMAFLGHLGPLLPLWPVGHNPQSMGW